MRRKAAPTTRGIAAGLAVALSLAGCKAEYTHALILVDTDIPPAQLMALRVSCAYDWDGFQGEAFRDCDQPLVVRTGTGVPTMTLPGTFRLLADPARPADRITLAITDDDSTTTLRRVARLQLERGRGLRLRIVLNSRCLATAPNSSCHPCPAGQATCTLSQSCDVRRLTCGDEGLCRSIDVAPNELVEDDGDAGWPDVPGAGIYVSSECSTGAPDAGADAPRD
jgi:hypothetical protein